MEQKGPTRAAFAFIFVTVVLDMLALGVIIPVLPKLIIQLEGGGADAASRVLALLEALHPAVVLHLGLAGGRARIALERVAVNVMDYAVPDNAGCQKADEPCVATGAVAYFTTLPLRAILGRLTDAGIPAYLSDTAGTYLCNQTLYTTLHAVAAVPAPPRVGFLHVPLLPSMVAASGLDQASMDIVIMRRAVEIALEVVAGA